MLRSSTRARLRRGPLWRSTDARRRLLTRAALGLALGCALHACSDDSAGDGTRAGQGGAAGSGAGGTGGSGAGGTGGSGAGGTGGSAGASGAGGTGGSIAPGACGSAPGQLFPPEAAWNTRIDAATLAADSAQVIDYLQQNHTASQRFRIDFSIEVLEATAATERMAFAPTDEHYDPDCDTAPVPVPEGGALEGESGYACESDGDCHLLVVERAECRLYEMWRADIRDGVFNGGCLAVWDIDRAYPDTGRGDYCTSADAAGLPITPLLVTADEVASGEVQHALRFILPNAHIRHAMYVRPGTHATRAASGADASPPYAALLRLRADADLSALNEGARVIAVALQRYGMYLADGGNLTFTMQSDRFTDAKWDAVGVGPNDLTALSWSDFEVVDSGPPIDWDAGDCTRTPLAE